MHPADQFEAWRGLIDKGHDVPRVAARFGVPETTVRKRLALSRVSPLIFELYREGTIDLDELQAFTVTDDYALQECVWAGMVDRQWHDARSIRHALTQADVPCSDRRVQFVGLEAYQAAGGTIRRDLFDPEDCGFLEDAALLDRLTREKLDAIAVGMKAAGSGPRDACRLDGRIVRTTPRPNRSGRLCQTICGRNPKPLKPSWKGWTRAPRVQGSGGAPSMTVCGRSRRRRSSGRPS